MKATFFCEEELVIASNLNHDKKKKKRQSKENLQNLTAYLY